MKKGNWRFFLLFVRIPRGGEAATPYERDGVIHPIAMLDAHDQHRFAAHFDKIEALEHGGRFTPQVVNLHLTDPVIWNLTRHPAVIQLAQKMTGRDAAELQILSTTIFCKYPTKTNRSAVVGWHQDLTYWELSPPEAWTLWIAIDEATVDNGALMYATGMHAGGQLQHIEDPTDETNVLMAKQSIPTTLLDGSRKVTAALKPGEAVWHDGWAPHTSPPNFSTKRRLGFVVNFIRGSTQLRPFSAKYEGYAEWRKPVLANCTHFPPAVIKAPANTGRDTCGDGEGQ